MREGERNQHMCLTRKRFAGMVQYDVFVRAKLYVELIETKTFFHLYPLLEYC